MKKKSFWLALGLISLAGFGCKKSEEIRKQKKPAFLMMNASVNESETTVQFIQTKISTEKNKKEWLFQRLDEIYGSARRKKLFLPIFKILPEELKEEYLAYWENKFPSDVPENLLTLIHPKDPFFSSLCDIFTEKTEEEHFFRQTAEKQISEEFNIDWQDPIARQHKKILDFFYEKNEDPIGLLVAAKLLFYSGRLADALKTADKAGKGLFGRHLKKYHLLSGKIAFCQGNYRLAMKRFQPFIREPSINPECSSWILDSYIALGQMEKAFIYLEMIRSFDFENPLPHTLMSLLYLVQNQVLQSRKEWNLARGLGAIDESFQRLSFYLHGYFPEQIPEEYTGQYQKWIHEKIPFPPERNLQFYLQLRRIEQYEKLKLYNKEIVRVWKEQMNEQVSFDLSINPLEPEIEKTPTGSPSLAKRQ